MCICEKKHTNPKSKIEHFLTLSNIDSLCLTDHSEDELNFNFIKCRTWINKFLNDK
jgi:hypothetical protein